MAEKDNFRFQMNISKTFEKDINKYIKKGGFNSIQEFFRESGREKLYGRNRNEEIKNTNLKLNNKEKDFLFKENKDLYLKLKKIEENI